MNVVYTAICPLRMKAGEVKRCMQRGPLLGYTIACPQCGHREMYTDETHRFVERSVVEGSAYPKRIVELGTPIRCRVCKRAKTIRDSVWVDA